MTEYYSLAHAATGIGVRSITIRRWIENGWLTWPKPYRANPQDHDKLLAIKNENQVRRIALVKERCEGRRKYHTPEERQKAATAAVKRYRHANSARVNAEDKQSKSLKRHPFFQEMKEEMLAYYGWRCLACRKAKATCMDHVRPLSQCGLNHPTNLQPLCVGCNTAKAGKATDYRHDKGKWLRIRWGGWVVNGRQSRIPWRLGKRRDSSIETGKWERVLGSVCSLSTFLAKHHQSVHAWRNAYESQGAQLSPDQYKSSPYVAKGIDHTANDDSTMMEPPTTTGHL